MSGSTLKLVSMSATSPSGKGLLDRRSHDGAELPPRAELNPVRVSLRDRWGIRAESSVTSPAKIEVMSDR